MTTTWNASSADPVNPRAEKITPIPWYLWCSVLAVTSVSIGAHWDVSWHRSIGRDSFWTPAHMAIYACGVLAAISCGYLILFTTFRKPNAMVSSAVSVFGFRAPLGAFIASWGGIAMLTSAPFDNWWHNAYGLDVKIVSPPHTLLMLGVFAVSIGTLILLLGAMNRAKQAGNTALAGHLRWLLLYVGGLMVVFQMFFRMEFTSDSTLHSAMPYQAIAIGLPTLFAVLSCTSGSRWACTWTTVIYSAFVEGAVLILPLFPAEPKLGPVFQAVTHFIPPKFPILLIVPAVVLDLLWSNTQKWKPWLTALVSGAVFVMALVAVEWPFADFLMSKASANRFFGTMYFGFPEPPTSFDVMRVFRLPETGATLWIGLGWAMLFAALSIWVGILLGRWMRAIQR